MLRGNFLAVIYKLNIIWIESIAILLAITAFYTPPINAEFTVFDGTLFRKKPNLGHYGIETANIIYESALWTEGDNSNNLPEQSKVRLQAMMCRQSKHMTIIDIERWELAERWAKGHLNENINKYLTVLKWFKEVAPDVMTGYYGSPPLADYWRAAMRPANRDYIAWQAENDRLKPIAELSDAIFPSLYAFFPDQKGWSAYAIAQISEARRYGGKKPVYAFLWPKYHDSEPLYRGKYLPSDYWRLQLETARRHADGIIIWGGWNEDWNENAEWWKILKIFLNKN